MLEKYPLLLLCPLDVFSEDIYLDLLAVRYVGEAVEHGPDWTLVSAITALKADERPCSLSLAVFALAVVETKERESLMTSAIPFAFLVATVSSGLGEVVHGSLLRLIELGQFHQCGLLLPELSFSLGNIGMFGDW